MASLSLDSLLSERDCWHCGIERELCLTIVVAGGCCVRAATAAQPGFSAGA